MTTRAEAIARAQANIQPAIDAARATLRTRSELLAQRIQGVYELPGVLAANASWIAGLELVEIRKTLLDQRVADGFAAPAVTVPLDSESSARATLERQESTLAARIRAINAYFDALEQKARVDPIVAVPPAEVT